MDDTRTTGIRDLRQDSWLSVFGSLLQIGTKTLLGPRRLMRSYVMMVAGLTRSDDHTALTLAFVPSLRRSVTKLVARNLRLMIEQTAIHRRSDYLMEAERRGMVISQEGDRLTQDAWALVVASRDPNLLHQLVQDVSHTTLEKMVSMLVEECHELSGRAGRSFEDAVAAATDW